MNIRPKITRIPTILGSTKKEFLELTAGSSTNKTWMSEEPPMWQSLFTYTGHRPLFLVVKNDETFPKQNKCEPPTPLVL